MTSCNPKVIASRSDLVPVIRMTSASCFSLTSTVVIMPIVSSYMAVKPVLNRRFLTRRGARSALAALLGELGPPRVQPIDFLLRRVQLLVALVEKGGIARDRRVRRGCLSLFELGFGGEGSLLHPLPLAPLRVGETHLRPRRWGPPRRAGRFRSAGGVLARAHRAGGVPLGPVGEPVSATAAVEREDARRHAVEEEAVVRDQHERAGEVEQALL